MDNATAQRVARVLASTTGIPVDQFAPDARLDSFGFDSLTLLEVALALGTEFAAEIDDGAMARAATVADVVAVVRLAGTSAGPGHSS